MTEPATPPVDAKSLRGLFVRMVVIEVVMEAVVVHTEKIEVATEVIVGAMVYLAFLSI